MGGQRAQSQSQRVWQLAKTQHGLVTRKQLLAIGLTRHAIDHRIERGRLHPVARGVFALGRPELTREGRRLAAVLSCGPRAVLSHASAASLWGIGREDGRIEVSVPAPRAPRRPGLDIHRSRSLTSQNTTRRLQIPVTTLVRTLIDIAPHWSTGRLEAAINEADKLGLTDPERLRSAITSSSTQPGAGALRRILDRRTFVLTDSDLERLFLPLARDAGLPLPQTGCRVNGYKVDFYWPDLGLVVETDGLRYHRTPTQQARDRQRDQAHAAAGLTTLRFTHAQVRFEPEYVRKTLAAVAGVAASRVRAS